MNKDMGNDPSLSKSLFGGGKGYTYSKLYISTLGEMFERIIGAFSYFWFNSSFLFGSYSELSNENSLHPSFTIENLIRIQRFAG